jgi:hypothetical protein
MQRAIGIGALFPFAVVFRSATRIDLTVASSLGNHRGREPHCAALCWLSIAFVV